MSFKHTARKTSRGVESTPPPQCGLGLNNPRSGHKESRKAYIGDIGDVF